MKPCLRSITFVASITMGGAFVHGQWEPTGLPGTASNFQQVWSDGSEYVYYAGSPTSATLQNALARYANGQWDMLDTLAGLICTVVGHHDTLFVGGAFDFLTHGVKYRDGDRWLPYGTGWEGGPVRRLRVLNDTLYAVGSFDSIDGVAFNGVAKRVGSHWEPVGVFPMPDQIFLDIALYRDTLVVIGSSHFDQGRGISYLAPGTDQWQLLGPGILGASSGAHSITVYQDQLYVGGQISIAAGNAGQEIMRWNGTAFEPLGEGLQFTHGNLTSFCDVRAMVEHNGLLFVGGGCNFTGDLESRGVAIWDGEQWCSVPGDPTQSEGVFGMDFLGDTLFITCGYYADDQWVNLAAKYVGDLYAGTCTGPIGIGESTLPERPTWHVDADGVLRVDGVSPRSQVCSVVDLTGRSLLEWRATGPTIIRALGPAVPPGTYLLQMEQAVLRFVVP